MVYSLKSCRNHLLLIFMLDFFKARVHYPDLSCFTIFHHPMAFKIRGFWLGSSEKNAGNFLTAVFLFMIKKKK